LIHHVPINLIGATVLSAVQYLSGRQMQAAVLDFGNTVLPLDDYILRRAVELISRNSSTTFEAKTCLQDVPLIRDI
jgi:hypothetical protein